MVLTLFSANPPQNNPHKKVKNVKFSGKILGFSTAAKFDEHIIELAKNNGWSPESSLRTYARMYDNVRAGLCEHQYLELCVLDLQHSKFSSTYPDLDVPPLARLYFQSFFLHNSNEYSVHQVRALRELLALGTLQSKDTVEVYHKFLTCFTNLKDFNEAKIAEYALRQITEAVKRRNFEFARGFLKLYHDQFSKVKVRENGASFLSHRGGIIKHQLDDMEQRVCPNPPMPIFDMPKPKLYEVPSPRADGSIPETLLSPFLSEKEREIRVKHKEITTQAWNLSRRLFSVTRGFEYLKYYCLRLKPHNSQIGALTNVVSDRTLNFAVSTHTDQRNAGILIQGINPEKLFPNDPLSKYFGTDPIQELREAWPHYAAELDLAKNASFVFSRGTILIFCEDQKFTLNGARYCLALFNEHYENRLGFEALYIPVEAAEAQLAKAKKSENGSMVLDEDFLSREAILLAALETRRPVYNLLSTKALLSGFLERVTKPSGLTDSLIPTHFHEPHSRAIMDQVKSLLNMNDLLSFARARFNKGLLDDDPNKVIRTVLNWHQAYKDGTVKEDFVPLMMALSSRHWSARFNSEFVIDPITLEYKFGNETGKLPPDLDFFREREANLMKRVMENYAADNWDFILVPRKQLY